MTELKKKLPTASDITKIKTISDGDFVSLVSVDVKEDYVSSKKLNITELFQNFEGEYVKEDIIWGDLKGTEIY